MPKTTLSFYLHIIAVAVVVFAVGNWLSSRTPDRAEGSPSIISGDSSQAYGLTRNENRESVFDRVMRTKMIRCGYFIYPPFLIRDPNNGNFSGIIYDAVEHIAKSIGLETKWAEEVNTANWTECLKVDRYDMLCAPSWGLPPQTLVGEFIGPLLYSGMGVWVRADDHRFDQDFSLINNEDVKISVVDGDHAGEIAQLNFPRAKIVSLPSNTDYANILMNVTTRKADVTFVDISFANEFISHNPDKIRNLVPSHPIEIMPTYFMVRKGEQDLAATMQALLNGMNNNGVMDKIIDKYEKYPGSFYRVAKPYQLPSN